MTTFFRRFFCILVIPIVLSTFHSCQTPEVGKVLSEGKVAYDVTYPELDSNNVLIKFLPDEMEMHFKENKYSHIWQAGLGLFKTGYYADCNSKEMHYILKLINVKYQSMFDTETIEVLNGDYPDYTIEETGERKEIAGYTCHEVLVEFPGEELKPFTVWYTTHLKIKDVNWCNPLSKIPGVMMEYQLSRYDLTMKFTATKVFEEVIAPDAFNVPKEYEKISNKRMEYKIRETFFSFQQ